MNPVGTSDEFYVDAILLCGRINGKDSSQIRWGRGGVTILLQKELLHLFI
jgi:hypothetical protein